jgi:hypothetical protein
MSNIEQRNAPTDDTDDVERHLTEICRLKQQHAECCVAMVSYLPGFSSLKEAIEQLGKRAAAARLSNAELAEAIDRAQYLTRNTGTSEAIYKSWVAHLDALLQAQRDRAALEYPA